MLQTALAGSKSIKRKVLSNIKTATQNREMGLAILVVIPKHNQHHGGLTQIIVTTITNMTNYINNKK